MSTKFENSLIVGISFVLCWMAFSSAGFILIGGLCGVFGGLMLLVSIFHCCKDIWEA